MQKIRTPLHPLFGPIEAWPLLVYDLPDLLPVGDLGLPGLPGSAGVQSWPLHHLPNKSLSVKHDKKIRSVLKASARGGY